MKPTLRLLLIVFLALAVSTCSQSRPINPQLVDGPITIDVFAARGYLGGSDYERYFVKNNHLWRECGKVLKKPGQTDDNKALPGDDIFGRSPNLEIDTRQYDKLSREDLNELRTFLSPLFHQTYDSLPPAGSPTSLSGPGVFELRLIAGDKEVRVLTSFDAISQSTLPALAQARAFFSKLRGYGPVICNSTTFFGIRRG